MSSNLCIGKVGSSANARVVRIEYVLRAIGILFEWLTVFIFRKSGAQAHTANKQTLLFTI